MSPSQGTASGYLLILHNSLYFKVPHCFRTWPHRELKHQPWYLSYSLTTQGHLFHLLVPSLLLIEHNIYQILIPSCALKHKKSVNSFPI